MAPINLTGFISMGRGGNSKWQNYVRELIKQFQAYIFAVVYFGLFRIFLIFFFHDKLDGGTVFSGIFLALGHGFRYDSAAAAVFLLVPFLANIIFSPFNLSYLSYYLRLGFSGFMYITMSLAFVVTVPYFKEYDSQFDYFLFEILYDDRRAVLQTVLESYNLFGHLLVFILATFLCFFLIRQLQKLPFTFLFHFLTKPRSIYARSLIVLVTVLLTLAAARGSFRIRPASRKWSHITTDIFLNQTVMNPIKHLQYAYNDFKSINSRTEGIKRLLGDIPIKKAAQDYFSTVLPAAKANDLSNYLLKTVSSSRTVLPDHIFLIIMESYDSWPFLSQYKSLKITENLKTLGRNGIFFNHFLPSGSNTIASLSTILTGIPYTGVNISRIAAKKEPFITSAPEIFKRLGYKTSLYYGGFLSWQNIGNLFLAQGIDQIYAAPAMGEKETFGVWGVEDEQLFTFVQANTPADEKTFNIIMTTSYHPPYNLDVKSKGFPLNEIPADIRALSEGLMDLEQFGVFWYCDREIGKFVNILENLYPSSLFAITGDHYGRKFLNARPTIYEHSSVPFILYGKEFVTPRGHSDPTPGSHIDIVPTIVDLIAPDGFQYHSFGRPMFNKINNGTESETTRFGIGYQTIVADNFIANLKIDPQPAPLPDTDIIDNSHLFHILEKKHNQLLGLGWWLIFRGKDLEFENVP